MAGVIMRRQWQASLALTLGCLPLFAAHAADGVSAAERKQGLSMAPELIRATGISCTVADARALPAPATPSAGNASAAASPENGGGHSSLFNKSSGGSATQSFTFELDVQQSGALTAPRYEIACQQGLGYLIIAPAGKPPLAYLCIETGNAGDCVLEGNSPAAQLTAIDAYLTRTGTNCSANGLRGVGHNAQSTFIEVACSNGAGYILSGLHPLQASTAQPLQASNCLAQTAGAETRCRLTDAEAQYAAAEGQLRQAHPECTVSARRYMGTSTAGAVFFEFKCADQNGYVFRQSAHGDAIAACADPGVAKLGGCTL